MTINRHNYEMYFLLYVDKELSAEERNAVEKFVEENADLRAELDLLIKTALPSEEIIFSTKNDLYKSELTASGLQEQMLLHLDNELDSASINALSSEIIVNADLKREWNILHQTKLDPTEKIIFENKQSLYRHERDRVITMRFWRAAAAILLLAISIFIGVNKLSKNKNEQSVASTGDKKIPVKQTNEHQTPNTTGKENDKNDRQEQPAKQEFASAQPESTPVPVKENSVQQQPDKNIALNTTKDKKNNTVVKNNIKAPVEKNNNEKNEIAIQKKNENNLPKPYFENINNQNSNKTNPPAVQDNINALQNKNDDVAVTEKNDQQSKPKVQIEDKPVTEATNVYAKTAVMDGTSSETGNTSVLFIDEEKVNRSKISGLFRKVKRVLTRNANLKTGNSVKIAGFEIAAK